MTAISRIVEILSGNVNSSDEMSVFPKAIDEYANQARFLGDNIFRGAIIAIPPEHHEIHCGDSYETSTVVTLGNGASIDILIICPDEGLSETEPGEDQSAKQYHFKGNVSSQAEATVEFFEDAEVSANGSALSVYCRNRNHSNGDEIAIYSAPTVTTDGTRLVYASIGSGKAFGGTASRSDEFILKDGANYLLRVTNETTSNNAVSIDVNYYVHPGV